MKNIIFIILLILFLPVISAVEFDMKTEFNQGETLMARVSGNFINQIIKENIFLYRGHVKVPMNFYVAKINDDFYIYSQLLGKNSNNYSVIIKNTRYMKGGQISEEDIVKNFSITEDMADFSIDPGFVETKDDFFIEVQNLQDYKINIEIEINKTPESEGFFSFLFEEEAERTIELKSGEIKKINFNIKNITESTFQTIELSTENLEYEIPVYISLEKEPEKEEEKEKSFRFEPLILNISISTDSNTTRIIYLYNDGQILLENISLSISNILKPYLSLSIEEIEELDINKSIKITLNLSSDGEERSLEGQIIVRAYPSLYTHLEVFLNFLKDYQPLPGEDELPADPAAPAVLETCAEMNGTICTSDEGCTGETEDAKDGNCCIGECLEIEDDDGWKIIGWIIIFVVLVFLYWFYKKRYHKPRRRINLLKIAKGKKK